MNTLKRFTKDDEAQDLIEYAILLAIIAVAVIASATAIGGWVADQFSALQTALGV